LPYFRFIINNDAGMPRRGWLWLPDVVRFWQPAWPFWRALPGRDAVVQGGRVYLGNLGASGGGQLFKQGWVGGFPDGDESIRWADRYPGRVYRRDHYDRDDDQLRVRQGESDPLAETLWRGCIGQTILSQAWVGPNQRRFHTAHQRPRSIPTAGGADDETTPRRPAWMQRASAGRPLQQDTRRITRVQASSDTAMRRRCSAGAGFTIRRAVADADREPDQSRP